MSPTNLILSSLVSEFSQRIEIQDFFFVCVCGGGGGGGGYERHGHDSLHIFYTQYIVMTSSAELCSFMKKILMVLKIESIAA